MGDPSEPEGKDVALLYAPTDDGEGARIVRARQGRLEAGEVRPAAEGQPLLGRELVKLHARPGTGRIYDVEVLWPKLGPAAEAGRPAVVANEKYRANWDRIFGAETKRGDALN